MYQEKQGLKKGDAVSSVGYVRLDKEAWKGLETSKKYGYDGCEIFVNADNVAAEISIVAGDGTAILTAGYADSQSFSSSGKSFCENTK